MLLTVKLDDDNTRRVRAFASKGEGAFDSQVNLDHVVEGQSKKERLAAAAVTVLKNVNSSC